MQTLFQRNDLLCLLCRPKSPEGVESVPSENDDHYDEETRRVKQLFS